MQLPLQSLLLLLLLAPGSLGINVPMFPEASQCDRITVTECKDIGYNTTTRHNGLEHASDQKDAQLTISSFSPLLKYQCSANLNFFLCSVLTPMCSPKWPKPIGPCRPLCESVRRRCYPVLKGFGFKWPEWLNCSKFPERNDGKTMCMDGKAEPDAPPGAGGAGGGSFGDPTLGGGGAEGGSYTPDSWRKAVRSRRHGCSLMRNKENFVYVNSTGRCALLCEGSDLFTDEDRQLAEVWMGALATLCAISSLATLLTFLLDRSRFKYPLRPVIFMSLCYLCYSISYFVRLIAGRQAAACDREPVSGKYVLIQRGLDNTNCAVVFLLQYFFSTAASAWYVILVLTWWLQAGWKWSPEAVARRSCYFHLPAWIVPVTLTVFVLIVRKVESDDLFGLCNVGSQNRDTLLTFVIVPNLVFLLLEFVFLLAGLIAMTRVRRHVKSDGQLTNKFDVLMGKIGLFSALYIIPMATITAFNIYEYMRRDLWHMPGTKHSPSVPILLIKAFASLAIGLTTVLWIWGTKTALAWKRLFVPSATSSSRRSATSHGKSGYQVGQPLHQAQQLHSSSPSWCKQQQQQQQQQQQLFHQQQLLLQQQQQQQSDSLTSAHFSDKGRSILPPQPQQQHLTMTTADHRSTFL